MGGCVLIKVEGDMPAPGVLKLGPKRKGISQSGSGKSAQKTRARRGERVSKKLYKTGRVSYGKQVIRRESERDTKDARALQ